MISRPRPGVGWLVAIAVLAWFLLLGAGAAGVVTALVALTIHPAGVVWIPLLAILALFFDAVLMREFAPAWFAWLAGRPRPRPKTPT